MHARRRRKGVLVRIRDAPARAPKRKPPLWKRVLGWVGGTILGVALLGMIVALGALFFNPELGQRDAEATVVVQSIDEAPALAADAAAGATVVLENRRVVIPITAERLDQVEAGTRLHVEYTYLPRQRTVRVKEWRIVSDAEDAATP